MTAYESQPGRVAKAAHKFVTLPGRPQPWMLSALVTVDGASVARLADPDGQEVARTMPAGAAELAPSPVAAELAETPYWMGWRDGYVDALTRALAEIGLPRSPLYQRIAAMRTETTEAAARPAEVAPQAPQAGPHGAGHCRECCGYPADSAGEHDHDDCLDALRERAAELAELAERAAELAGVTGLARETITADWLASVAEQHEDQDVCALCTTPGRCATADTCQRTPAAADQDGAEQHTSADGRAHSTEVQQ